MLSHSVGEPSISLSFSLLRCSRLNAEDSLSSPSDLNLKANILMLKQFEPWSLW
jgi:hypothetical protein